MHFPQIWSHGFITWLLRQPIDKTNHIYDSKTMNITAFPKHITRHVNSYIGNVFLACLITGVPSPLSTFSNCYRRII